MLIKDRLKVETIDIDDKTKQFKLIIDNVQINDSGKYKLEATNKCSTESSQTDFEVKGNKYL